MNTSEFLANHGWRKIGQTGGIKYWDHPNHQPDERGAFTTTDAVRHQKDYEKDGVCSCSMDVIFAGYDTRPSYGGGPDDQER